MRLLCIPISAHPRPFLLLLGDMTSSQSFVPHPARHLTPSPSLSVSRVIKASGYFSLVGCALYHSRFIVP